MMYRRIGRPKRTDRQYTLPIRVTPGRSSLSVAGDRPLVAQLVVLPT